MGSQTRLVSAMDPTDRLPFDPTIRIPPIQDPSPLRAISSHRPSPLEPSAADGNRPSSTRLHSRAKALASAQPLTSDAPLRPLDTRHIGNNRRVPEEEGNAVGPRKRQRLEYVQLPRPHKPSPLERNTSLDTIPRVNQLHEPPPSAARFPPITTNAASPHISKSNPRNTSDKPSSTARATSLSRPSPDSLASGEEPKKTKRNYTRGRRMWTEEETDHLLRGVARYGVGKWKRILNDDEFSFPSDRTAVDLKDRYRTCRMHEERKIERHANGEPTPDEPSAPVAPPRGRRKSRKESPKAPESKPVEEEPPAPKPKRGPRPKRAKTEEPKTPKQQPGIDGASISTVAAMAETLARKGEPAASKWSIEDDQNLSRGFQKHGFHWTAITKDAELSLQSRTGAQLRDRFRVKFPIHYQSSVPIELPEPAAGYDRDQRPRRRGPKGGTKVSLVDDNTPSEQVHAAKDALASASGQRSKNMSIADITAATTSTPRITKTSLPSMQSLCAQVDAQPLPEPTSDGAAFIDIQPLPEEDDDFDESDLDGTMSDATEDDYILENNFAGEDEIEHDRSREDVHHLSISGLLNETESGTASAATRLPPFRSTYDGTHEGWNQNSMTLPPLLLEASKPMFEAD